MWNWLALPLWLRLQAVYYMLTGIWPLLHMASFEAVTGPKVDDWLVRMVGLLAGAIGLTLWRGARIPVPTAMLQLSALTAGSFLAIDVFYALAGRISSIYLLDAAVELVFLFAVLLRWRPLVRRGWAG